MVSRQQQGWACEIDPGEFRGICRELFDAVADYHADLSGRGVATDLTPEHVRALFAGLFTVEGASPGEPFAGRRERVVLAPAAAAGLRELFSKNLWLSRRMHELVREHPDFEVLHEPALCPYRFRYVPHGLAERQEEPAVRALLDRLNREIVEAVRRSGLALVTTTRVHGRVALRMSVCPHGTSAEEIDVTFEGVARWGRLLNTKYSVRHEKPAEMEARLCSSESHSSPTEVSAT
jgi:hypothetical protein